MLVSPGKLAAVDAYVWRTYFQFSSQSHAEHNRHSPSRSLTLLPHPGRVSLCDFAVDAGRVRFFILPRFLANLLGILAGLSVSTRKENVATHEYPAGERRLEVKARLHLGHGSPLCTDSLRTGAGAGPIFRRVAFPCTGGKWPAVCTRCSAWPCCATCRSRSRARTGWRRTSYAW